MINGGNCNIAGIVSESRSEKNTRNEKTTEPTNAKKTNNGL